MAIFGTLTSISLAADGPVSQKGKTSATVAAIVYSIDTIQAVTEQWPQRDGAIGFEISDFFCDALLNNPDAFFFVMRGNQAVFSEWLESMADLSFVDFGACTNRECVRKSMISVLKHVDFEGPGSLRKRLLAKLEATKVRKVD